MIRRYSVTAFWAMVWTFSFADAAPRVHSLLEKTQERTVVDRLTLTCSRALQYWMGRHIFKCQFLSPHTFFVTRLAKVLCDHAWKGTSIKTTYQKDRHEYAEMVRSLSTLLYNDLKDKGVYPLLWKRDPVTFAAMSRFWLSGLEVLDSNEDQESLIFCVRKLRVGYGDHPLYERLEGYLRRPRYTPCVILDYAESQLRQEVRDTIVYEQFFHIRQGVNPEDIVSSEYRVNREQMWRESLLERRATSEEFRV